MTAPLSIACEKISSLVLGTWALGGGSDWGEMPVAEAQQLLYAGLEKGIYQIDTSPVYGWGECEKRLAEIIRPFRQQVFLASKCGICLNKSNRPDHDLSPASIITECETSLKRLKTDYLDLYQLHWPDVKTPLEDSLSALIRLKKEGKIRSIGICNFPLALLQKACQCAPIEYVQYQLSLLAPYPTEILDFCCQNKIAFWGYGVLGGGILSGKYQKEPNFRRADARKYFYPYYTSNRFIKAQETAKRVKEIAAKKGICAAAVALSWGLKQSGVRAVMFGARNKQQVLQNIQALKVELTDEEKEFLQHG